jgi:hypothetical protein
MKLMWAERAYDVFFSFCYQGQEEKVTQGKEGTRGGSYTKNFFFPFDPSFLETRTDRQTDGHTVAFIYRIINERKHRPLVLRSRLRSRLLAGRWDFPPSWVRIEGAVSFPFRHLAGLFRSKLNVNPPISIDSFCAGAIFFLLSLSSPPKPSPPSGILSHVFAIVSPHLNLNSRRAFWVLGFGCSHSSATSSEFAG